MTTRSWLGATLVTLLVPALAACGSQPVNGPPISADPIHGLLTLGDLEVPGFTVVQPAQDIAPATLEASSSAAAALRNDNLTAYASVRFFRSVDPALANGPFDITASIQRFDSVSDATHAYASEVAAARATAAGTQLSPGALGDAAFAIGSTATTAKGARLVQYVILWRVANDVNELVMRGRDGATSIGEGTSLAQRQTARELGRSPS